MTQTTQYPLYPSWVEGFRDEQTLAADRAVRAFQKGTQLVLCDAPTGVGKTLIPDMVRRQMGFKKSIYVCSGIELQDQQIHDFPYTVSIKGRDNYPTEFAASSFHETGLDRISCADCTFYKGSACRFCDSKSSCPYEMAKANALGADYANMNSSYFLTETNYIGRFSGWDFVAIDEADTLDQQMMSFIEIRVTRRVQRQLAIRAPRYITKPESWAEWYVDAMQKLGDYVIRTNHEELDDYDEVKHYQRCRSLWYQLKSAGGLDDDMWSYVGDDNDEIVFRPTEPAPWGMTRLFNHAKHMLLMSATLLSGDVIADQLGFEGDYDVVYLPSPFPIENRPIRFAPVVDMSYKGRADAMDRLSTAIDSLIEKYRGENVLVHTHTYSTAKALQERLSARHVLTYTSKHNRHQVLDLFKKNRESVLLAPSMERGIDLPDDLCRLNIICQLPYPYIGDRQISKRVYGTGRKGKRWFMAETMRALVQACGRGVRHENDHCDTWVLDSRAPRFVDQCRREGIAPKWWVDAIQDGPWITELALDGRRG